MYNNQGGFFSGLVKMFAFFAWLACFVLTVGIIGWVVYIANHFVHKYW